VVSKGRTFRSASGRQPSTFRRRSKSTSSRPICQVKKEDVKVEFEDGVLTVEGERRQEKEEKGKTFHKIERGYGKFVRRFALPTEVDATKVSAEFKEGVLNVHLPKSPNGKPKATVVKVA
jgi:HSP20 family protein